MKPSKNIILIFRFFWRFLFLISILYFFYFYFIKKRIDKDNISYYKVNSIEKNAIVKPIKIKIDSVSINDLNNDFSGFGYFITFDEKLFFLDEKFGQICEYSDGALIKKFNIFNNVRKFFSLKNSYLINENEIISYNEKNKSIVNISNNKIIEDKIIFKYKRSNNEIINNPLPHYMDIYDIDDGFENIFQKIDENYGLISLTSSHPLLNNFNNNDFYIHHARIFGLINLNNGKIVKVLGRKSPELAYKNNPMFDHFIYYVNNDTVFVNYLTDPTLYIIDIKHDKVLNKFGESGIDMKTNYTIRKSYDEITQYFSTDFEKFGYYTSIFYDNSEKVLLRTYKKGENYKDGLQVYNNFNLVLDTIIPNGLKIKGKIGKDKYIASKKLNGNKNEFKFYYISIEKK